MAKEGNQWWRLRAKHGREMLFSSPDLLWEACCEYFEYMESSDYWKDREVAYDKQSADFKSAEFVIKAPYTYEGLLLYLGAGKSYFTDFRRKLKKRKEEGIFDEVDEGFSLVLESIDAVITKQQQEGAMTGKFNANIVARLQGLKDQSQLSTPSSDTDGSGQPEFKITLKLN